MKESDEESVLRELADWRSQYIDVQAVMDEFVELRNRGSVLRDEVTLLTKKIEESDTERVALILKKDLIAAQMDTYMRKAQELRTALEAVLKEFNRETGKKTGVDLSPDLLKPVVPPPSVEVAPAAPPPPPPPPPPGRKKRTQI